MKATILKLALAATVASGVSAQPHRHGHHMHFRKSAREQEEKREANPDVVVEWVPATATVYQIGESIVPAKDAADGIKNGLYVVVGETTPTFTPPPPPSTTSTSSSIATTSSKSVAVFIELTTSSTSTTPTPTPTPSPSSTTSVAAAKSSSATSGATGIDAEFPDGEIDCKVFPSAYGAVSLDWLGTGGWDTIQKVPNYSLGDLAISFIETAISGQTCGPNSFCSYACPSGYAKSQWPTAQGSTGQSIGGLYCNAQGKLELTRSEYKTLCQKGAGGVSVRNELGDGVATCQTSYPGSESMVIPTWTENGETAPLTNIYSPDYYTWQGKSTTAQFYVNYAGIAVDDACVWNSKTKPLGAGNWAPLNLGIGKDSFGITYISLFPNLPTSSAVLDFDIEFEGDYNGECAYKAGGTYIGGSSTGCTIGVPDGKSVTIVYKKSS